MDLLYANQGHNCECIFDDANIFAIILNVAEDSAHVNYIRKRVFDFMSYLFAF